jgi:uncharacterized membrane protein YadS
VLAAAFPVSVVSGQVGTLVKLVRVLMLGPVVVFFAMRHRAKAAAARGAGADGSRAPHAGTRDAGEAPALDAAPARLSNPFSLLARFVPWFITGFLALAALRSIGAIPESWVAPTRAVSGALTVAAMAALGLGVDVRAVGRAGRPVVVTVTLSLVLLVGLSLGLIRLLGIA